MRRRIMIVVLCAAMISGAPVLSNPLAAGPAPSAELAAIGRDSLPHPMDDNRVLLWNAAGDTFATFGPNAAITIDTGIMAFLCDWIYPTTDIYIVPSGSVTVGSALHDVSGLPNVVVGASGGIFVSETIGYTKPGGSVGPGTYAVIYDECQDGRFDAVDFIVDPAFEVAIPANVPPIDPAIQNIKAQARTNRDQAAQTARVMIAYLGTLEFLEMLEALVHPGFNFGFWFITQGAAALLHIHPVEIALDALIDRVRLFAGVAADPPDPNFRVATALEGAEAIQIQEDEILYVLGAERDGTEVQDEAGYTEALLHAMERYQGADEAGNGEWALRHARDIRTYALGLRAQLLASNEAMAELRQAVASDPRDLDGLAARAEAERVRIEATGLTQDEWRLLKNAGLSDARIEELKSAFIDKDFVFEEATLAESIDALTATHLDLVTAIDADLPLVEGIIAQLEADPLVLNQTPEAAAGGPYAANQGVPLTLDASGSSDPDGDIIAYAWDLDRDGAFDDATGVAPSVSFDRPTRSLVGVRVTDSGGRAATAYAALDVAPANTPPTFESHAPDLLVQDLPLGTSLELSVVSADDDGDPVTLEWRLDDVVVSGGAAYLYQPNQREEAGIHVIRVSASDGTPAGTTVLEWTVAVWLPDPDGDGWSDNTDCDETDPAVNPGTPELCDGADQDCDGVADDGFDVGGACTSGVGSCARGGTLRCAADGHSVECDAVPGDPVPESCNGLDDDCNGVADNGFPVGQVCQVGIGACRAEGRNVCTDDGTGVACDAVPGTPAPETCNNLDDDCNGTVDDDGTGAPLALSCYTGPAGTVGVGACRAGLSFCAGGLYGPCTEEVLPASETCNAVDDDCDGAVDDMGTVSCGVGGCRRTVSFCIQGELQTCQPGEPGAEVCNGIDDDCDGTFDEGFDPRVCKTWTTDPDFDTGTLNNVVHSVPDQLQLDDRTQPFNFIWVAVSSKGTTVKIDTSTGQVLGEYRTAPQGQPTNPSRTTVDLNGNVWNTNRDGHSVVHIGLAENNQCVDRNGNGVIDTSTGLGDVRPWPNTGDADTNGGVSTAQDECILHYVLVRAWGTRHVSVTRDNNIWISGTGSWNAGYFDLLDGDTGAVLRQAGPFGYGGYGGLIDANEVIWSARPLLRWDTRSGAVRGYNHDSYGLCIDSHGNVWNSSYQGDWIHKFAPNGDYLASYRHGDYYAQGCVIDGNDHVWVANSLYRNTVGHLKPDGSFVGNVTVGSGPTGVAVDGGGKIWATNYNSGTVSRIDPDLGPLGPDGVTHVGQVDYTSPYLGGNLYNYSDMTGSTLRGAPRTGSWEAVYDSQRDSTGWRFVHWSADVPGDGTLVVLVATSADGVTFGPLQEVSNGSEMGVPRGRYLKVRAVFGRATSGESPILYNLTVTSGLPPVAQCRDVTIPAGADTCEACASVDDGSHDPDGPPSTVAEEPTCPFGLGTTEVTLTVTDPDGQSDSCRGTVTVVDRTPPSIVCPEPITLEYTVNCRVPSGDLDVASFLSGAVAADACDAALDVTHDAPPSFPLGSTVVTFTAVDDAGLSSSCTSSVTVVDLTPPVVTVAVARDVLWPPNHKMATIVVEVDVRDECDPAAGFILDAVVSNEPDDGLGDGDTARDIQGAEIGTPDTVFRLRSERSGLGTGRIYTASYTGTDAWGNAATTFVQVLVPHDMAGKARSSAGSGPSGTTMAKHAGAIELVVLGAGALEVGSPKDPGAPGAALARAPDRPGGVGGRARARAAGRLVQKLFRSNRAATG